MGVFHMSLLKIIVDKNDSERRQCTLFLKIFYNIFIFMLGTFYLSVNYFAKITISILYICIKHYYRY